MANGIPNYAKFTTDRTRDGLLDEFMQVVGTVKPNWADRHTVTKETLRTVSNKDLECINNNYMYYWSDKDATKGAYLDRIACEMIGEGHLPVYTQKVINAFSKILTCIDQPEMHEDCEVLEQSDVVNIAAEEFTVDDDDADKIERKYPEDDVAANDTSELEEL